MQWSVVLVVGSALRMSFVFVFAVAQTGWNFTGSNLRRERKANLEIRQRNSSEFRDTALGQEMGGKADL